TGTKLVGMVMPGSATGAVTVTTAYGNSMGAGNFTVTPTLYPSVQQGAKLVGPGSGGSSEEGIAVALSADGNTAIEGGSFDNNGAGAAWVFTRHTGAWTLQTRLLGSV